MSWHKHLIWRACMLKYMQRHLKLFLCALFFLYLEVLWIQLKKGTAELVSCGLFSLSSGTSKYQNCSMKDAFSGDFAIFLTSSIWHEDFNLLLWTIIGLLTTWKILSYCASHIALLLLSEKILHYCASSSEWVRQTRNINIIMKELASCARSCAIKR